MQRLSLEVSTKGFAHTSACLTIVIVMLVVAGLIVNSYSEKKINPKQYVNYVEQLKVMCFGSGKN